MLTTKDNIIRAGILAFSEKGYTATGIELVLSSAHAPRGSFYHHFKNKEQFAVEVVGAYVSQSTLWIEQCLGNSALDPLKRLAHLSRLASRSLVNHQFGRGCILGNLSQEVTSLPSSVRDAVESGLERWGSCIFDCLRDAQRAGLIAKSIDCSRYSRLLLNAWEGSIQRARVQKSVLPIQIFEEGMLRVLSA